MVPERPGDETFARQDRGVSRQVMESHDLVQMSQVGLVDFARFVLQKVFERRGRASDGRTCLADVAERDISPPGLMTRRHSDTAFRALAQCSRA